MDVRGERECKSCGTRWSYFETGSVECPSCGSRRSVGVGERETHTDTADALDLAAAQRAGSEDVLDALEPATEACREYCRSRGFVSGGTLLDLDDTYLAAAELWRVGVVLAGQHAISDDEQRHVVALLHGAADGERPTPAAVPASLRGPRGLAAAAAVDAYRTDVRAYCGGDVPMPERDLLERAREHGRRVDALDGEVDPQDSARLVAAVRAVGDALRGDEAGIERARTRLNALG
ncbi:DUF7117 family protein [Halobacterium salinarum]|uniref:DUF7117 family protein n=1 Tax=Halobacterium salinarum TaxID=2242 RepID=UPI002555AEF9|nr:TFIIB-type zinc ribbon-containing protein [Halobacterium salinarum]MDL0127669.1 TFIIB-type zinc ribbon-containing protein [Halobacterium salinarum]